MIAHLLALAALTCTYALALASFAPWDLAVGAIASAGLLFAFRRLLHTASPRPPGALARVAAALPLAAVVAKNAVSGTWQVLRVMLARGRPRPQLIAVPLGERSPAGAATSALLVALTPGTLLVDVDQERGVMLVHAVHAPDPDAVVRAQQELYERYQRRVVP